MILDLETVKSSIMSARATLCKRLNFSGSLFSLPCSTCCNNYLSRLLSASHDIP